MSLAAPVRATPRTAADARAAIVAALNAVGFHASTFAPDSPTAGAAWPQWVITQFDGHICDPSRFQFDVYAVLEASDPETTIALADAAVARAVPALIPVATVTQAEPVLITFADQTTMPGVRIRAISRA